MTEDKLNIQHRAPAWVYALALAAFGLLLIPILTMIWYSFLIPDPLHLEAPSYGLQWYERLADRREIWEAMALSARVGAISSLLSTIIGTLGAIALERGCFPGKRILQGISLVPVVLPELVMGLMSLLWFSTIKLSLGPGAMILAHTSLTLPYLLLAVRTRLRVLDPHGEWAAADLGAGPISSFFYITLPQLMPAMATGALMAFTLSFDDFLISFFTAGARSDTLPIKLYGMIKFGLNREIYAISTLLLLLTGLCLFSLSRLGRNLKAKT